MCSSTCSTCYPFYLNKIPSPECATTSNWNIDRPTNQCWRVTKVRPWFNCRFSLIIMLSFNVVRCKPCNMDIYYIFPFKETSATSVRHLNIALFPHRILFPCYFLSFCLFSSKVTILQLVLVLLYSACIICLTLWYKSKVVWALLNWDIDLANAVLVNSWRREIFSPQATDINEARPMKA